MTMVITMVITMAMAMVITMAMATKVRLLLTFVFVLREKYCGYHHHHCHFYQWRLTIVNHQDIHDQKKLSSLISKECPHG